MFRMSIDRIGQFDRNAQTPLKAMRFGVLLGALIAISVTVNALIIIADGRLRDRHPAAQACSTLTNKADGRTCFGSLAPRPDPPSRHSANGAELDRSF